MAPIRAGEAAHRSRPNIESRACRGPRTGSVRENAILGGEPRTDSTRIGVRHVAARVVDGGQTPTHVADTLDSTLADVCGSFSDDDATLDERRAAEEAIDEAVE